MDSAGFNSGGLGQSLQGEATPPSSTREAKEERVAVAIARCRRLLGQINSLQLQLAEATAEAAVVIEEEGELGYGFKSMQHRIGHELHLSSREAKRYLDVGEGIDERPALADACRTGAFGLTTAAMITRSAEGHNEAELVEHAHDLTSGQLSRTCAQLRQIRDDVPTPVEPVEESISITHDALNDRSTIRGTLSATNGAALEQALAQRRNELTSAGQWATNADALIDLITNGPTVVSDRFLALLNVNLDEFEDHLSDRRANNGEPTPGRTGVTTQAGLTVTDDEIDRLFGGLKLRWIIRRDGHPLWVSHQSRTAPEWMRHVLRIDQPTCVVDGCTRSAALHAHHLVHWEDKPETSYGGMALLCGHHHRLLHKYSDYRLRAHPRHPGLFVLVDSDGELVHPQPRIETPGEPPPDVDGPSPPLGERLTSYGRDIIFHHLLRSPPDDPDH